MASRRGGGGGQAGCAVHGLSSTFPWSSCGSRRASQRLSLQAEVSHGRDVAGVTLQCSRGLVAKGLVAAPFMTDSTDLHASERVPAAFTPGGAVGAGR